MTETLARSPRLTSERQECQALVDPAELAACRTAADVDALVERIERERRMVEELEP